MGLACSWEGSVRIVIVIDPVVGNWWQKATYVVHDRKQL